MDMVGILRKHESEAGISTDNKYIAISRLMVVSREAKKEQSELPKTKCVINYCVSFT